MRLFSDDSVDEFFGVADIIKHEPIKENKVCDTEKVFSPEEKEKALAMLKSKVSHCFGCRLSGGRTNIVFGEGNPKARLMFIGEGPGADEDATGRPFVGRSGQLLTQMITAMGLTREEVYIANIVKCRPPMNRNPHPDEAASCIGYLKEQIRIVNPEFIVCLGSVAVAYLFGRQVEITKERGTWRFFDGHRVMLSYHPSFLLRQPGRKKEAWIDLQMVMKAMEENK